MGITRTLAALFAGTLVACAQQMSQDRAEERLAAEDALRAQIECGREHVSEVDDGISDASTVALALALRCHREYLAAGEAWGAAYLDNDNQRYKFRKRRAATSERTEAFLPIVMKYRTSAK
jgi:hypothetical protein